MDLNAISIFCRVVQAGSFSAAARNLNMPKSTVSHKVAELEESLGVTLLQRTTRKLRLTEAGQAYFDVCARVLGDLNEARSRVSESREDQKPRGVLRLTAPAEMGTEFLGPILSRFLKENPEVELDLVLTDRFVDFVAENIDVAIRAGELEDSSLIARKLGMGRFQLFASPGYLRRHPAPKRPQDLERHSCLRFTIVQDDGVWDLRRGDEQARVAIRGRSSANNLLALKELAAAGQGIVLMPQYLCTEEVRKCRLVQVLPGWATDESPIHAVYPAGRFVPPKVRAFVEFASAHLPSQFKDPLKSHKDDAPKHTG